MADSTINTVACEYDLASLLDLHKLDILFSMNCHAIGTIQGFDEATQTAMVSLNYKKVEFGAPGAAPTLSDYPLLLDCPCITLSGGAGGITFPIAVGDTCFVFFNDRDIDNWYSSGQIVGPATGRLHSFSDAIALVGLRSAKNPIAGFSTTKTVWYLGTTKVSLGAKIKAENAATDLKTALDQLYTALDTFFTATSSAVIEPTLGPAAAAAKVAVAAAKTTLAGLLE